MPLQEHLQRLINSFDEGLGLNLIRGLIAVIVIVGLFAFYVSTQFRGLREPAAMDAAQIARNLSEGKGMTTRCIRPFDIGFLGIGGGDLIEVDNFPEIRMPPLYPALLAVSFTLLNPSFDVDMNWNIYEPELIVVLPLACLLIIVIALLVTGLAGRLFDLRVAATALSVFVLSEAVYMAGISGTSAILDMLLTTLTFAGVACAIDLRGRQVPAVVWLIVVVMSGVCCGLAVLSNFGLLAIVPAAVILLGMSLQRWRWTAISLFLVALVILLVPWMVRNQDVTGSPFGLAGYAAISESELYPDDALDRSNLPELQQEYVAGAIKYKFLQRLQNLIRTNIRALGEGVALCFFFVAMFCRLEDEFSNRLKWSAFIAVVLLIVSVCLGSDSQLLSAILPLVAIIGTGFFFEVLDRMPFADEAWKKLVTVVFVFVAGAPMMLTFLVRQPERPYPPYAPPYINYVGGLIDEGETLCTDIPWATAWYGKCASLLLPQDTQALEELDRNCLQIGGVYLTQATGNKPYTSELETGRDKSWLPLLRHLAPEYFRWKHGAAIPPGTREQIFLTDRPRWEGGSSE